jgi:NAD(P)-dependent dehydrogenase (short-subunit alcohol dehydrogenase family)
MTNDTTVRTDPVVLVTGGTSGIGLATARLLLRGGAHVVITGRRADRLEDVAAELRDDSVDDKRLLAVRSDAARLGDIDGLLEQVRAEHGRLDGIFANAGVAMFASSREVTEEDFDRSVDVNFKGVFFLIQRSLPLLEVAGGGSVLINASISVHRGMAAASVYSATKAAVHNLARTLGADLAGSDIRVNTISPGPVVTDMFTGNVPDPAAREAFRSQIPLGRLGHVDDVAEAASFLLSPRSSFITGQDLVVDGGLISSMTV